MDPIGFSLENFDALGVWRDKDENWDIDTRGVLPDGTAFNGPAEMKKSLLARKDQIAASLIRRLLTYALGRGVEYYDRPAIQAVTRKLAESDYRFSVMVTEIARSDPFRKRKAPESSPPPAPAKTGGKTD
jgi:hypothetical protein